MSSNLGEGGVCITKAAVITVNEPLQTGARLAGGYEVSEQMSGALRRWLGERVGCKSKITVGPPIPWDDATMWILSGEKGANRPGLPDSLR